MNTYQAKEVRPFEGRPGANDHMQCGSMRNGVIVPYAPPKPILAAVKPK